MERSNSTPRARAKSIPGSFGVALAGGELGVNVGAGAGAAVWALVGREMHAAAATETIATDLLNPPSVSKAVLIAVPFSMNSSVEYARLVVVVARV
jgi:hypothetical protein